MITLLILWQAIKIDQDLDVELAKQNAEFVCRSIEEFRTIYSEEVVTTAKRNGLEVSHLYDEKENAIPIPTTLSLELANRIAAMHESANVALFSPYPFPWKKAKGLSHGFRKEAWNNLNKDPSQAYFEIEKIKGDKYLRYAVADVMRKSCIECHNTHPDSPRTDWKLGDVRGVFEVSLLVGEKNNISSYFSKLMAITAMLCLCLVIVSFALLLIRYKNLSITRYLVDNQARAKKLQVAWDDVISDLES